MEKEYQEIDYLGSNLKDVVRSLLDYRKRGRCVSTEFNGHIFYSDTVTLDGAYLEVCGKTYSQTEEDNRKWRENYKREEEEFKKTIPKLTIEWIEKGHKILDEKYWKFWDEIVPIRLDDLYRGMELRCCLDIVERLNNGCTLKEAKKIIEDQNHSGMSYGLVRNMVANFCKQGKEFFEYTKL